MARRNFERALPWSGAVAGLAWIGQAFLFKTSTRDYPGYATTRMIRDHLALNYAAVACLVVMGIALSFFAAALRRQLRSSEAEEATYSAVAYGGLLLVSAGLSQMVMWNWGLINGAADAADDEALHILDFVGYFGFAGMGIGLATTFLATGLGGLLNAALPRWFAVVTLVLSVLSALGAAGIPPGGLVNYLLLPFWLIATAAIIARRQRTSDPARGPRRLPEPNEARPAPAS